MCFRVSCISLIKLPEAYVGSDSMWLGKELHSAGLRYRKCWITHDVISEVWGWEPTQDIGSTHSAEGYSPKTFLLHSLVSCEPHHRV